VGRLDRTLFCQSQANVMKPRCFEAAHRASMRLSSQGFGHRQLESLNACATPQ
jgi:hypothetical protein